MRRSAGLGCLAIVAGVAAAQPRADGAFEKLTSLAGEWQAELAGFGTMTDSIRLVSNGQAIEETIGTPADNEVSIYTRRGGRVLLTHFCAMTPGGHQVRLEAGPVGDAPVRDSLTFDFVGATNLPAAAAPHMRRVVTTFIDGNHFTERWTKTEAGKDTIFDLQFVRRQPGVATRRRRCCPALKVTAEGVMRLKV